MGQPGGNPKLNTTRKRAGRIKGEPNKVTKSVKEVLAYAFEMHVHDIRESISMVRKEQGHEAFLKVMLALAEYVVPKLARQENVHSTQDSFKMNVSFNKLTLFDDSGNQS